MGSVLEALPRGGRVAVIRLRSLGDCVLTTPALTILRRFRPDLYLSVVVERRWRAIFEGNTDIDEILPPELGALRRFRPDLCLNFHGGTRSAWMTALSGARHRVGFGHFRGQAGYNVRIPRAQEILGVERTVHTAEHLASAIFYLGAPVGEIPRARLTAAEKRPASAVIHAVAATPAKTWSAEGFLEVARRLRESHGEVVFIGGPGDDLAPFREFTTVAGAPLGEIKSRLATATLFVGNDSGPAHMAAAFGVPSVVIFGASDPAIWGPWRTPSEVVTAPGGIGAVRVEQVLAALTRLRVAA
ncbi:MAG: glycosyltransferase family 9 protein [Acidobacteriia bacterium]|nr:glycosyltransferase family 9 protein [Terriglobia bacterium]